MEKQYKNTEYTKYKTYIQNTLVKKISLQPLFDAQTVQPAASRYIDYAKYLLTSWATITFSLTLYPPCIFYMNSSFRNGH